MKVVIFALFCLTVAFADYTHEDGVVVLTDDNFHDALNEFDFALVEFYAPWCGHCKSLAPNYAAAAQKLAKSNPEIKLCKVDATVEKNVASKFEVKGFPTLKFFVKGNSVPVPYEGGRSTDEIVSWLKKKSGPSSVEAKNVEDAEKLIGDNEIIVIFFGPADSEAYTTYLTVTSSFDDLSFAHTHDKSTLEKYEVSGETIVIFKKFDEGKNVYTGPFTQHQIRDFINAHRYPTILPFDQKAAQKIFGESNDALILIIEDNDSKSSEVLSAVAPEIKDKLLLSLSKIGEGLGTRLAEYIGVDKNDLPAVRIVQPGNNMQKFIFDKELTADNLKSFVQDFLDKKLTPNFKSEPIPAESHDDGVRVVVGKNFKDVVLGDDNDVLMEYYAPWCGHCKSLAPIYSSLATKLKDVEGIVIGKMDATANEVEGLSIQGFPTLKFYKKGNKSSPEDYNGERTEDGFLTYLRQHSSAKIPQSRPEDIEL